MLTLPRFPAPVLGSVLGLVLTVGALSPTSADAEDGSARTVVASDDLGSASWISFAAENDSFVGGGASYLWSDAESTFHVGRSLDRGIEVTVQTPGRSADFAFAAPAGETLAEGTYTGAQTSGGDPGRPTLDVTDGGSCGTVNSGSFTVRDIAPDLSTLWIEYRFSCGGISGEIRLDEPVGAGPVVAPTSVPWSDTEVGLAGRIIPVTVINDDEAAFSVRGTTVTSGAEEFAVRHSTCGVVDAGDFCRVWVQLTPRHTGERSGVLTVDTDAGVRAVPLHGLGVAPVRSALLTRSTTPAARADAPANATSAAPSGDTDTLDWQMSSDAGSWVGQGRDYSLTDLEAFRGYDTLAVVDSGTWSATLTAPLGQLLLPGTVVEAREVYDGRPVRYAGPRVSGEHRACNRVTDGRFEVHEAEYDRVGVLQNLVVGFSQTCDDDRGALRGVIAVDARGPVPPVPGSTTPQPTVATSTSLRAPARATRSARSTLAGRVVATDRSTVAGRVRLERWDSSSRRWRTATSDALDARGRFSARVAVPRATRFRARYVGSATHSESTSAVVRVRRR